MDKYSLRAKTHTISYRATKPNNAWSLFREEIVFIIKEVNSPMDWTS